MSANIWVVDDDRSIRFVLERALKNEGWHIQSFEDADSLLRALRHDTPDLIFSDIRMPGMDGIELLSHLSRDHASLPVIVMTAHSDLDSAVNAYESGAFEYLPKPFDIDMAIGLAQRAMQACRGTTPRNLTRSGRPKQLIGANPAMQEVFRAITLISIGGDGMINGKSGSGKNWSLKPHMTTAPGPPSHSRL